MQVLTAASDKSYRIGRQKRAQKVETDWLYHHGAPRAFGADAEFCNKELNQFFRTRSIDLQHRPSKSTHKNGRVERNNGVWKEILQRLEKETTTATPKTIVKKASFMTNIFQGNSTLTSFQLARGYSPIEARAHKPDRCSQKYCCCMCCEQAPAVPRTPYLQTRDATREHRCLDILLLMKSK